MLHLITGILYPYILLAIILVAVYVSGESRNYPRSFHISWLDIAGGAIWLAIIINILVKNDGTNKFAQLLNLLLYLLIYLAARFFLLHGRSAAKALLCTFAIIALLEAVNGILQYTGGIPRANTLFSITGSMANPAVYADFMITLLPGPLLFLFTPKKHLYRAAAAVVLLISITALLLAEARSAWIALIIGSSCLVFFRYRKSVYPIAEKFSQPLVKYAAVILLLFVLAFAGKQLLHFKQDSTTGRWFVYKTTLKIIADHPLSGIGFDRFKVTFNDYQEQYFKQHPEDKDTARLAAHVTVAYNEFLQTWCELGIAALLLLLFFLAKWLNIYHQLIKTPDILSIIVYAYGLAILVLCCFSYPFRCGSIVINILFLTAIMADKDQQPVCSIHLHPPAVKAIRLMMFVSALLFAITAVEYINYLGNWHTLMTTAKRNGFNQVAIPYQKLYNKLENEPQFLYTYGTELCLNEKYQEAIPVLKKAAIELNYYDLYVRLGECYDKSGEKDAAEKAYLKAAFLVPNRFYPRYKLMKYYAANGAYNTAVKWANIITAMEVKIPSTQIDSIKLKASALIQLYGER
jgi:O-antigen polymerase